MTGFQAAEVVDIDAGDEFDGCGQLVSEGVLMGTQMLQEPHAAPAWRKEGGGLPGVRELRVEAPTHPTDHPAVILKKIYGHSSPLRLKPADTGVVNA